MLHLEDLAIAQVLYLQHIRGGPEVLHLKDLYCTKIVHIRACYEGQMGTGEDRNLLQLYPEGTVPEAYGIVKKN